MCVFEEMESPYYFRYPWHGGSTSSNASAVSAPAGMIYNFFASFFLFFQKA